MNKVAEFTDRYRSLSEWELAEIHAKSSTLIEEARIALAAVISERGIDFNRLRQEEIAEQTQLAAIEQSRDEKRTKRDARLFKAMLIIGVPVIVLGALLRPERTYETFISALVQGIGIALIAWVVLKIKRSIRQRKP